MTIDEILKRWRGHGWIVEGSQAHEMSVIVAEVDRLQARVAEFERQRCEDEEL